MGKPVVSLKQLAESKSEGIQKATYFKVDPRKVECEPGFNVRDETGELKEHLESMYLAMKAGAFFPPIDVRVDDGKIIIVDGHCRTLTACRLIAEGIDVQLEARQFRGNEAERVAHMLTSAQGKSLTPLEAGRAYFRLIRFGMSVADIVARTGTSDTKVRNCLALAEAPVEVQEMLRKDEVSAAAVVSTLKKHGPAAGKKLGEELVKAKAKGKTKVVNKGALPKAVADDFIQAAVSMRKYIGDHTFELIQTLPEDKIVSVPVGALKMLLNAQGRL